MMARHPSAGSPNGVAAPDAADLADVTNGVRELFAGGAVRPVRARVLGSQPQQVMLAPTRNAR
jgi:hypothetical protein